MNTNKVNYDLNHFCDDIYSAPMDWQEELHERRVDFQTELRFNAERHHLSIV